MLRPLFPEQILKVNQVDYIYCFFVDNIQNNRHYRYPENGKTSYGDLKKVCPHLDRKHNPSAKIILKQARVQYVLMKGFVFLL